MTNDQISQFKALLQQQVEHAKVIALQLGRISAGLSELTDAQTALGRRLESLAERTEFGMILAGLRDRGVITDGDIERLGRDGSLSRPQEVPA